MTKTRPLVEHVVELRRRMGEQKRVVVDVALAGLGISSAGVPDGREVHVDLTLESIPEGVVATGTVGFPWAGECRRCLRMVTGTETVALREVFQADPVEGETWPLGIDTVDLEPVVREAVLLALPLAPLCAEGCLGPDPDHFPTGAARQEAPAGPDPRWAPLDQLHFD